MLISLYKDTIQLAREFELPILRQLSNFTEEQLFDISRRGFVEDILIPLSEGSPFEKVDESIAKWKANAVILPKDKITAEDLIGIYQVRKLALINSLKLYDCTKDEFLNIIQELEYYFAHCVKLGYRAYEEIQRGALKESQEILEGILCNIPVVVSRIDKEGNTLESIGCGLISLGLKNRELVGTNVFANYPNANNTRRALNGESVSFQSTAQSKSGETRHYQSYFFPDPKGVLGFSIDITDQKLTEEKLKEREYFINRIADSSPMLIHVYDRITHSNIYANKEFEEVLGYSSEEINAMGKNISQIIHQEDLPKFIDRGRKLDQAKDGEVIESEIRVKHFNGDYIWLYTRSTVFKRAADGKVLQTLSTSLNTTEIKKSKEKLEQQLRIFDTALSNTVDFYYIFDLNGRFVNVNKPLLDLWGISSDQAIGKNLKELGYPDDLIQLYNNQLKQVVETKAPLRGENTYSISKGKKRLL